MFNGKGPEPAPENADRPDADGVFADVFDEVGGIVVIAWSLGNQSLTITIHFFWLFRRSFV